MQAKDLRRIAQEGKEPCKSNDEEAEDCASNELKLLARGMLPIGMIEETDKKMMKTREEKS